MEAGISRLLFSASSSNAEDFDTETEDGEAANRRDALNLDSSLDTGNQDSTDITGSNTPIEETVSRSDILEVSPELLGVYDMQGYYWNPKTARRQYRKERNNSFAKDQRESGHAYQELLRTNAKNLVSPRQSVAPFYEFFYSNRRNQMNIYHFQLRHLLSHYSDVEVCFSDVSRLYLWNKTLRKSYEVLDLKMLPSIPLQTMKICCLTCTADRAIIVGGYSSQLLILKPQMIDYWNCDSSATLDKRLRDLTSITLSFEQNKIVNHVRAFHTSSTIAACCNDKAIALIDPDSSTILRRHTFPYAINAIDVFSNDQLMCAIGDSKSSLVYDLRSGSVVSEFGAALDFSFGVSINQGTNQVAIGSEDHGCRIYDLRNLGQVVATISANMNPISSVLYSPDGMHLAVMESADYLTLYDVLSGYELRQTIDVFGEFSGITFSSDSRSLMAGVRSADSGSLIEFFRNYSL